MSNDSKQTKKPPPRTKSRQPIQERESGEIKQELKILGLDDEQISELLEVISSPMEARIQIYRNFFREWYIEEYDQKNKEKRVKVTIKSELLRAIEKAKDQGSGGVLSLFRNYYRDLSMTNSNTLKNRKKKEWEKKERRNTNEDLVYKFDPEGEYKSRKRKQSTENLTKTFILKIPRKIKNPNGTSGIAKQVITFKKKIPNAQSKKNPKNHQTSKIKKKILNAQPKKNQKKKPKYINNKKVKTKIGKGIHLELTKKEKTGSCLKHSIILKKESELKTVQEQNINAQFKIVDNEPSFDTETTCPNVYFDNFQLFPFGENDFFIEENPKYSNSSIDGNNNSILLGNHKNNVKEKKPHFEGLDFSEKNIIDFESILNFLRENQKNHFGEECDTILLQNQEEDFGFRCHESYDSNYDDTFGRKWADQLNWRCSLRK
ncbi:hypothetical protein M0813_06822 [Anaeramoeba flamelloides]|uniref:Uncharacterized protein n=1 Tax=Anaeramoeba flamelloides TaxID=1746091 RepID=A0ABQ8XCB6_9EUKA|nr:hypothetical protein M0813_06822 [Anaeramoeba flamelloides]